MHNCGVRAARATPLFVPHPRVAKAAVELGFARILVAGPGDETRVEAGQIFAWNPSISGVKVEDTILITPDGADVITAIDGWPTVPVEAGGRVIPRPVILEK